MYLHTYWAHKYIQCILCDIGILNGSFYYNYYWSNISASYQIYCHVRWIGYVFGMAAFQFVHEKTLKHIGIHRGNNDLVNRCPACISSYPGVKPLATRLDIQPASSYFRPPNTGPFCGSTWISAALSAKKMEIR